MHAGCAPGDTADHGPPAPALDQAPVAHRRLRHRAPPPSRSISSRPRPSSPSTAALSSPSRGAPLARRAGERESFTGLPRALTRPTPGIVVLLDHAARDRLRIGERLGHAVDRPGGNARPPRTGASQWARVLAHGHGLDLALELGLVRHAVADPGEARIVHEALEAEDPAEARPEPAVGGAHGEAAVARAKGLVRRVEAMGGPEPARDLSRVPVLRRLPRRQRQPRLEERRVDELAPPRHAPGPERAQDTEDAEEPRAEIGDRHADLDGGPVGAARRAHDAAHALRDEVVAAAVRVGPRLPEARDGAVDEPRIDARRASRSRCRAACATPGR